MPMTTPAGTRIAHVGHVALAIGAAAPAFQGANAAAIDAYWAEQSALNPRLFDGRIYFAALPPDLGAGRLTALAMPARFATMLYWRDHGVPDAGIGHLFAAAIPRTADGALILAEMAAHTSNPGRIYFPGGLFDAGDVRAGRLDPDRAIRRELSEETGLDPAALRLSDGFVAIVLDYAVGVAKIADLPWPGEEALARTWAAIRARGDGEVAALHLVRRVEEADILPGIRPYAKDVIRWMLT